MKYLTHWATALIILAVWSDHYSSNTVVETVRLKQFDLLQQTDKPNCIAKDIGIVTIDEKSIEAYGQWSME